MSSQAKAATARETRETFSLYLLKPSHYDDTGYVVQWYRSAVPANSLACVNGIALDCDRRGILGPNVDIETFPIDECNTRIRPKDIIRKIRKRGGKALIALIGVQSNQYPRAMDLARPFRAAGLPVCIGGFHASGCLAMLPKVPKEIEEAWELGISIFAGEAEGRLEEVLCDAYAGTLKPLYNFMNDLPSVEDVPIPFLDSNSVGRTISAYTSFDSGRGCPFQCSFCTIINVQGRKSRYRSADDIENIIRANYSQGVRRFFITDDNFARNRNWEAIFDRIILLRQRDGLKLGLIIQVDTLCHLIPNFVEKSRQAGVKRAFIGLENINPDNLLAAKKKQNRITEYRTMLQAWKSCGVVTYCGYIVGFPADTRESILRDIEIIKKELPIDILEFFCLTPLPGSEDHKVLDAKGVPMDPDLNKYDLEHVCTGHAKMSPEEFQGIYDDAWDAFYTPEHVETIIKRALASGMPARRLMRLTLWFYGCQKIEKVHPLQGGYFRLKYRTDRRPGFPVLSPFLFYPFIVGETLVKAFKFSTLYWKFARLRKRAERVVNRDGYSDLALTPVVEEELDDLELYQVSAASQGAVQKLRDQQARKAAFEEKQKRLASKEVA